MPRPIWKGHISFGLVNVPVILQSAEQRADLHFNLIDSRNEARVRYERVNEETGEEVPWNSIVKGFEYDENNYVLLKQKELEKASPELTKTIEIEQFVDLDEIDVAYFDKPYYLVPDKGGRKGYVLLREAMKKAGQVGIAQVAIRSRGHLAAVMPQGDVLLLELLRFHQEIRSTDELDVPTSLAEVKVTKKELELAGQLIEGMSAEWTPEKYRDEYRDALMELIESRISKGETAEVEDEEPEEESPRTVNFMDMLKKSVAQAKPKETRKRSSRQKKSKAS